MQGLEECDSQKRIKQEIKRCFTFDEKKSCIGAGGRKLRQVCVWCPCFKKEEKHEKGD